MLKYTFKNNITPKQITVNIGEMYNLFAAKYSYNIKIIMHLFLNNFTHCLENRKTNMILMSQCCYVRLGCISKSCANLL